MSCLYVGVLSIVFDTKVSSHVCINYPFFMERCMYLILQACYLTTIQMETDSANGDVVSRSTSNYNDNNGSIIVWEALRLLKGIPISIMEQLSTFIASNILLIVK